MGRWMVVLSVWALLALFCWRGWAMVAQETIPATRALPPDARLYDPDPEHLWNRVHRVLLVRQARNGRMFGIVEVDPLLWKDSTHLLEGESHQRAVAVLDEFLATRGERLIADPVKRVVLQGDLWAIFDWTANSELQEKQHEQRRALQTRLAEVIRRLGLREEEIARLPANYTEVVKAKRYDTKFDEEKPEQPFLPADLLDDVGDWIKLGSHEEVIAPVHTHKAAGRSLFMTLLRLPGGNGMTVDYLKRLREFAEPWVVTGEARIPLAPNPALPQFPAGTQVALVRQMMAPDAAGKLRVTPLVLSVQLRVYRKIQQLNRAGPVDRNQQVQSLFEFELSREGLFAGKGESLRPTGQDELKFHILNPHAWDMIDYEHGPQQVKVMQHCLACHNEAGIFSVQTYTRDFGLRNAHPPSMNESNLAREWMMAERWKRQSYEWGLLEGLWERR